MGCHGEVKRLSSSFFSYGGGASHWYRVKQKSGADAPWPSQPCLVASLISSQVFCWMLQPV